MTYKLSAKGAAIIRYFEGFRSRYYLDAEGVGTIGTGFTWASRAFRGWWARNKPGVKFGPGATMTKAEADAALSEIVDAEYGAAVSRFLEGSPEVPQHVYDGMCSPVFNMGEGSLDWRWAAAIKAADFAKGAQLLSQTGTTGARTGRVLKGLVRRRKEEAELIEHGDYAIGGAVAVDIMADGVLERGERGEEVRELQRKLAALGHYDGAIDGIFGHGTEAAVLEFQRAAGLADDAHAGPKTLAALDKATAPKVEGKTAPTVQIDAASKPASTKPQRAPEEPVPNSDPRRWRKAIGMIVGAVLPWAAMKGFLPPEMASDANVQAISLLIGGLVGVIFAPENAPRAR